MTDLQSDELTPIPARFTLAAFPSDDDASIAQAKEYVRKNLFTSDDVKIVRDNGTILVVTKREVTLKA